MSGARSPKEKKHTVTKFRRDEISRTYELVHELWDDLSHVAIETTKAIDVLEKDRPYDIAKHDLERAVNFLIDRVKYVKTVSINGDKIIENQDIFDIRHFAMAKWNRMYAALQSVRSELYDDEGDLITSILPPKLVIILENIRTISKYSKLMVDAIWNLARIRSAGKTFDPEIHDTIEAIESIISAIEEDFGSEQEEEEEFDEEVAEEEMRIEAVAKESWEILRHAALNVMRMNGDITYGQAKEIEKETINMLKSRVVYMKTVIVENGKIAETRSTITERNNAEEEWRNLYHLSTKIVNGLYIDQVENRKGKLPAKFAIMWKNLREILDLAENLVKEIWELTMTAEYIHTAEIDQRMYIFIEQIGKMVWEVEQAIESRGVDGTPARVPRFRR